MFALISLKISDLESGVLFPRGYVKTSNGVSKIEKKYFLITTEKSRLELGLATGEPDVRTFGLGAPFLSLSLSHIILVC
jgi:hypothetical protein